MNPISACYDFSIPVEGVIHVGANRAKEYWLYQQANVDLLLYVEAIPELVEVVQQKLDSSKNHFVRQAVVTDVSGERVNFNVSSNDGLSSSILPLGEHARIYPSVTYAKTLSLKTERLDNILAQEFAGKDFNVLILDVQGAELKVLQGSPWLLSRVDAVFAEVSSEPLYEGGCTFLELSNFLACHGFAFRTAAMSREGWGDAFYTRKKNRLDQYLLTNLALGKPAEQSSMYRGRHGPSTGVNGVASPTFNVHTAADDPSAWWKVDLQEIQRVRRIIYLDRPNFEQRAKTLGIFVSPDDKQYEQVFDRREHSVQPYIDLRIDTQTRFIKLALAEPGPLHFRQLIAL